MTIQTPPKSQHNMVRRASAAQATVDHFRGRPFAWGACDCASVVAFHLRQLEIITPLRSFGSYQTALGARKALKRKGFDSLAAVLDSMSLAQIAPAYAVTGDVLALSGSDHLQALVISVGNHRVFGFHESETGAVIMQARGLFLSAWRVI